MLSSDPLVLYFIQWIISFVSLNKKRLSHLFFYDLSPSEQIIFVVLPLTCCHPKIFIQQNIFLTQLPCCFQRSHVNICVWGAGDASWFSQSALTLVLNFLFLAYFFSPLHFFFFSLIWNIFSLMCFILTNNFCSCSCSSSLSPRHFTLDYSFLLAIFLYA